MVWAKRYNNNVCLNGYNKYSCQPQRIVEIEERERERKRERDRERERERERTVDSAVSAKKMGKHKSSFRGKVQKTGDITHSHQ